MASVFRARNPAPDEHLVRRCRAGQPFRRLDHSVQRRVRCCPLQADLRRSPPEARKAATTDTSRPALAASSDSFTADSGRLIKAGRARRREGPLLQTVVGSKRPVAAAGPGVACVRNVPKGAVGQQGAWRAVAIEGATKFCSGRSAPTPSRPRLKECRPTAPLGSHRSPRKYAVAVALQLQRLQSPAAKDRCRHNCNIRPHPFQRRKPDIRAVRPQSAGELPASPT